MPDNIWRNGQNICRIQCGGIDGEKNTTLRMGYTRIEPIPGGARRLAMPELNSGAIDKVSDGIGQIMAQGRIVAEAGAKRGLIRHIPEPTTNRRKKLANKVTSTEQKQALHAARL